MSSLIYAAARDLWAAMHQDYDDELQRRIRAADEATHGYLVNKRGRAAGVTGADLFKGAADRAYQYATRELIDHWAQHGRLNLAAFEAEWLFTRGEGEALAAAIWGGDS